VELTAIRRQARTAGWLYLLMALIAPIGLMVVPNAIIVPGDAAATADRLRESAWLMRVGIASELFHQAIAIFIVLTLYRVFRDVDERKAVLLVVLGSLVSVPIAFLNVVNEFAALTLVGDAKFLAVFDRPQLDALAYLFLRLHARGLEVASIFWGLWLFPFGSLVMGSGFMPRILGALLWVAGAAYVGNAFIGILLPQIKPVVSQVAMILYMGELPIILWLAFWGAREQRRPAAR
jgi:hypothetical protein